MRRFVFIPALLYALLVSAQEKPTRWDLQSCISYALTNNIQIKKANLTLETNKVSTLQAKAALLPDLSASISQQINMYPVEKKTVYTGSYGLNSSLLLFDGGKTNKSIQQQKLQEKTAQNSILESQKSIQMSLLQVYAKILYADEAVKVYQETVKTSEYQLSRGLAMLKAGSISKTDLAQLESQLSSDKYQLVVAQNTLSTNKLSLKQLLELSPGEDVSVIIPALQEADVLKPIPSLQSVYETALNVMPQIKSARIDKEIASLETSKAKAAYLPKLSLTGAASSGHTSGSSDGVSTQLGNNFYAGVGLSLSVPVFTNRSNKSTLEKARIAEKTSQLDMQDAEKSLLKEIETVYQDAISAQSQYVAASEKVLSLETSYHLLEQQFSLGMKNTLDLLTEKNNLLSARQSLMQAKYTSIMDAQILNLYQDIPVNIK